MGKKCCVYGCKTNYSSEKGCSDERKVSVFRFPTKEVDRQAWVGAIPNAELTVGKNSVVCELHWPSGFETVMCYGKPRPKHPPSIWPNVPSSQIPTPAPSPRSTKRSSCFVRNVEEDEIGDFQRRDSVTFDELKKKLLACERDLPAPVVSYMDEDDDVLVLQSKKMLTGVPLFMVRISHDQRFENSHLGVKCTASSLSKNRINKLEKWSALEENIRFLNCLELDNKKQVIQQQLQAMRTQEVGKHLYSTEIIMRGFRYFATSRCLYHRLREDFQLPSVRTLTRITSKVSKMDETSFSTSVFRSLEEKQKECVLLQDEVYVKKMMLYHGGQVFGKSVDDPQSLAKTMLGIMVSCMFGGPTFLSKILPISKLNSVFLHDQVQFSIDCIQQAGGRVSAVICDGNRNNQALFKQCAGETQTPWKTATGVHLLYDFVHLLKNIRNNWLTELTGELQFELDDGVRRTAKWSHLIELEKLERASVVKMSDLTEVAVSPKPIERQKVSTCLKIFSEKTHQALLHHTGMKMFDGVSDTAVFINTVLTWWKIVNVKSKSISTRRNDDLKAPVSDPHDPRLDTLLRFGDMALQMGGKQGKRQKQLTRDTSQAIFHTCNGLVSLCRQLLSRNHQYVLLGKFSTDPLEKEFSKLRQGSGGTYFINVQQVVEKSNINKAELLVKLKADMDDEEPGHSCADCGFMIECDEEACETADALEQLEESLPDETKAVLVYIAGYITRKDPEVDEVSLLGLTSFYFQKFGGYTDSLDRGGLNVPSDRACQWTIFCFILFNVVKEKVCRQSFSRMAMTLSDIYELKMEKRHARIVSNILLNNYCRSTTPSSTIESALKRLKLSLT